MEIVPLLAAVTQSIDIGKRALASRDSAKVAEVQARLNTQAIELTEKIIQLQQDKAALVAAKRAAEADAMAHKETVTELTKRMSDLGSYEPFHTPLGGFCLAQQPEASGAQSRVYLCANCAARGQKTFLQFQEGTQFLNCAEGHGRIPGMAVPDNRRMQFEFFSSGG
ncbi:hypothetical protein KTE26_21345 [Ralstonia mannitolilytica]|uniref:hypothetical protein n=1 Tax=Ralstonia mannitolilytica TaxID=105219 RepID=UPI000CEE5B8F|nr:hypothetical protein [Ralstonia mannitolilytica]MBU9580983.1 hypothetical protein [Ralstonia mannitolilytica]